MGKRDFVYLAIIAALLAVVFFRHRGADTPEEEITETVRTEEAAFYRPDPIALDYHTARVVIPRWLFSVPEAQAPSEDLTTDSVEVSVRIEERTYRDSTFEARISGPAIGNLRPTLDHIRTFGTTREVVKTISATPTKWWEVRATARALYASDRADLWAGITADRHTGRWSYGAAVGYSLSGHPIAEIRAGYRLFGGEK